MNKKLLLILALTLALCLIFAVACDPPEKPNTPSVTPDMQLLEAAKIVFSAPDTYVTSFLSEEDTIPYLEICKIGNEITIVNRTEDGIKQLHYVKDNGNGSAEYFGYELPYGKTSYEKTELSGEEALSYYENTASFAGSAKSIILLAMMTGTGYAGKDMVDESNYDEIIATLEEINFTKDENGIWHTPYADAVNSPVEFAVGTDCVTYFGSEIYHTYMSAPETPAEIFASSYAEIEDKISDGSPAITSDMTLKEAVEILTSLPKYHMTMVQDQNVMEFTVIPKEHPVIQEAGTEIFAYGYNNELENVVWLAYYDYRGDIDSYLREFITYDEERGIYERSVDRGENAAMMDEHYPPFSIPLLLSFEYEVQAYSDEYYALFDKIDELYRLDPSDGWYKPVGDMETIFWFKIGDGKIVVDEISDSKYAIDCCWYDDIPQGSPSQLFAEYSADIEINA